MNDFKSEPSKGITQLGSATAGLALPLRAINVSSPDGWDFDWCAVDANNRIIGYCMNETQAKQLVAPFAVPSALRELAERCRPAVAHDARLRERDVTSDKYAHTYKPVLKAEAERAAKLLDDIDAILGNG